MNQKVILIVDDIPTNIEVLMEVLNEAAFEVLVALDGHGAIEQAHYAKPDIILLDVMMPGIDGFETCRRLKAHETTREIPVIFMTALSETVDKVQGFRLGAVDYITKPLQHEEVLARVNTHLTLRQLQQDLQAANQQLEMRVESRTAQLGEAITLLQEEINERSRAEQTLRAIVEGTATATGRDFLQSLVRHLATTLEVSVAFVTECLDNPPTQVRTLAYWNGDSFRESFTYPLAGTPCDESIKGRVTYYPEKLAERYPDKAGYEAYIGVPLYGTDGEILGHLAIYHDQPMEADARRLDVVKIFAARAGAELERKNAEEARQQALETLQATNRAYSRFVPLEFLQLLHQTSITELQLGDQIQMEMTILFADIRSFTTLSETMTPQENFRFINSYLSRVSPIVREYGGFIDKYIGDAIMALFPGQTDDAVRAAIALQKAVCQYNEHRRARGYRELRVGVGLHTGTLMLGIIGESERMEGTVISDAVNLAARMEGLTKNYGANIVMSEQTLIKMLESDQFNFRFLDWVQVKGKTQPVSVFEIFDGDVETMAHLKGETKSLFEEALLIYHDQEFAQAAPMFEQIIARNPDDVAAQIYLTRCREFITNGTPNGWHGVETLEEK